MSRIVLVLVVLSSLSACATVGGVGQDLQSAGRAIERESYEARN